MSLGRYFKIAWRWWWLALISMLLTATAAYIYTIRQPNIYMAKSTVRVGTDIIGTTDVDAGKIKLSRALVDVYSALVRRNSVTGGVVERLGLEISSGALSGMINTAVVEEAQLLEIFVTDVDPERAAFLANALADELVLQSPGNDPERKKLENFIRLQLDDLQKKITQINQEINEVEISMENVQSAAQRQDTELLLKDLESRKREYQDSYSNFISNLSADSPNQVVLFERASVPGGPVGPNVRNNVIMAAAVGLMLAIAGIVVIEFLDDTIAWQDGLSNIAGATVLGTVAKLSDTSGKIVTHDKLWSPEASVLRDLRDSIYLAKEDQPLSTVLITSPLSGDGKSFITANLGVTVATAAGSPIISNTTTISRNIILVDADLRQPALHEIFDIPNVVGLSDVLMTPESAIETTLKQALRPTYLDNLFILPAGRILADPGSLINSTQFTEVIRYLKERSQLVIVDSAPILDAVETRAIDNIVDATLLIINSGRTRKKMIDLSLDYFDSKKNNNFLGVVFNRVNLPYTQEYMAGQALVDVQQDEKISFWRKLSPWKQRKKSKSTLTLAEAAVHLGVKQETVRRWCETGRIQGIKTGNHWKVRMEDLEEYITFYKLNNAGVHKVLETSKKSKKNRTNGIKQPEDIPALEQLPAQIEQQPTKREIL